MDSISKAEKSGEFSTKVLIEQLLDNTEELGQILGNSEEPDQGGEQVEDWHINIGKQTPQMKKREKP